MSLDRLTLIFSGLEPVATANDGLVVANQRSATVSNLKKLLGSLEHGRLNPVTMTCQVQPVFASGTLTISSGSGSVGGTINGTSVTVTWATSDTASATALAAAINATAALSGYVTASSAAGVVTITAAQAGLMGNAITLVASGTGVTASGSGRLTGGTNGTAAATLAQASATFTYSSSSGSTTATLNGVAFTQASGTDAARGAALSAAIRASANPAIMGLTASDNGSGVVTVSALANGQWAGAAGNSISLAVSGTGLSRSGANATGGADGVNFTFTY